MGFYIGDEWFIIVIEKLVNIICLHHIHSVL